MKFQPSVKEIRISQRHFFQLFGEPFTSRFHIELEAFLKSNGFDPADGEIVRTFKASTHEIVFTQFLKKPTCDICTFSMLEIDGKEVELIENPLTNKPIHPECYENWLFSDHEYEEDHQDDFLNAFIYPTYTSQPYSVYPYASTSMHNIPPISFICPKCNLTFLIGTHLVCP